MRTDQLTPCINFFAAVRAAVHHLLARCGGARAASGGARRECVRRRLVPTVHVCLGPVDDDPDGGGRYRRRPPATSDDGKACCTTVTLATTPTLRHGAPLRLEDETRRTPLPLLRRPTVAGSLDADEDDAVHFASAAICRLRVMPRAARACDTARRYQR